LILEFTGLPGSGKTTIATQLIDRLEGKIEVKKGRFEHLGTIQRIGSKFTSALTSFYYFPKDSFLIIKELFANHISKAEAVRDCLNILYLMERYHNANKEKGTVHIFDQGLIQAFLSSTMFGKWSDKVFEIIKKYPDRVILVNVDPETSAKRLIERANQNSRSQKQRDKVQHLIEQGAIVKKIIYQIDLQKDKYLVIENDQKMDLQEIDKIKYWLINQVQNSPQR